MIKKIFKHLHVLWYNIHNVLTQEQKNTIITRLNERLANHPCPRCGNNQFALVDGLQNDTLQDDIKNIKIGGQSIPTIIVACNRCGFLSYHSLGVLGLMDLFQ